MYSTWFTKYVSTATCPREHHSDIASTPQAILSQFSVRRKGSKEATDIFAASQEGPDLDQEFNDLLDSAELDLAHDADDEDPEEQADADREAADEEEIKGLDNDKPLVTVSAAEEHEAQLALQKVRVIFLLLSSRALTALLHLRQILVLSNKVWHSPTVRTELARLAGDANLNSEVLVRAVKTRWNTVTHVLERALEMRPVLTELCDMSQFNKGNTTGRGKGIRLRRFILDNSDWDILEQLHRLLQVRFFLSVHIYSLTSCAPRSPSCTPLRRCRIARARSSTKSSRIWTSSPTTSTTSLTTSPCIPPYATRPIWGGVP